MRRVLLIHWHESEARERLKKLERCGFDGVWFGPPGWAGRFADIRSDPPDAFVIDLDRLPSHGREVAAVFRQQKRTRHIPLVFVNGAAEKVAALRERLPDATYTDWSRMKTALSRAIQNPPADPVVWKSESGPYSGTPLPAKLGLKPGATLLLLGAPRSFQRQLGEIGDQITIRTRAAGEADLLILFVRTQRELARRFPAARRCLAERGALWVAWPKKTSGVASDLSDSVVRKALLATGLVDYKVCAIDEVWSGLKFGRRRT